MEFLSQEKNENFYYDGKDSWFNVNTNERVMKEVSFEPYRGDEASIRFYSTGALVTYKIFNFLKIYFVRNDGKRLFNFEPEDVHKMEKRFTYVAGYGCGTGVLLSLQYEDNSSHYEYHTYGGVVIRSNDFCDLVKKVNKFEEKMNVYYSEANKKKEILKNIEEENNKGKRI